MIGQTQIRVRPAQPRDGAALAGLEAVSWSAESGFPSVIQRADRDNGTFFSEDNPPEAFLVAEQETASRPASAAPSRGCAGRTRICVWPITGSRRG